MRTCIGCGACQDKRTLIRIAYSKEKSLIVDPSGKAGGRGAYLCLNPECLEKAFRRKALARAFRADISKEDIARAADELRGLIQIGSDAAKEPVHSQGSKGEEVSRG